MNCKISVVVLVFNHEKYIVQCLNSIITQNIKCDIEIIISNDCSTDDSDLIISEYINKNGNKNIDYVYFNHKINLGAAKNLKFSLEKAKGEFIALCEGDDFWTNKDKLALQYNFMINRKEYFVHFGDSFIFDNDLNEFTEFYKSHKVSNPIDYIDIIKNGGNLASTNTVFFRNDIKEHLPFFEKKGIVAIDRALLLLLMLKGKFWFEKIKLGAYRVHSTGLSNKGDFNARVKFNKSNIILLQYFNDWTEKKIENLILNEISIQAKNVLYFSKNKDDKKYFKYLNVTDKIKVMIYKFLRK